jgi:FtsP/CotA-like multicopper oxidase with cupredoxin domain
MKINKTWRLAGLASLSFTLPAQAAIQNLTLYIDASTLAINGTGGATLNVWSYSDGSGSAMAAAPGPILSATEGDTVNVTVVNHHTKPHNFVVRNVSTDTTSIPAGGSHTYSFAAPAAGSYVYGDTLDNNINREMGLYGALVVRPADGAQTAWTNGPAYDFERVWVMSEMDKPRWNDVAASGGTVNTAVYKPNYFMMNGLGGFDAMMDMNVMIHGSVGQTALVRIVNAGQYSHSLHFHANHFQIVAIDGVPQTAPFQSRDTLNVPPNSTADVLYTLSKPGEYPMHVHTAQMETANGTYLNGAATMIMMH